MRFTKNRKIRKYGEIFNLSFKKLDEVIHKIYVIDSDYHVANFEDNIFAWCDGSESGEIEIDYSDVDPDLLLNIDK